MAKVPLRTGLLADVSNNEDEHSLMKSIVSKLTLENDRSSVTPTEDIAAFSPRTDLANKLSHTSLICNEQNESELSDSPPDCTPSRRPVNHGTAVNDDRLAKNKRSLLTNFVGRLSPLVIADEQTKYPELDDSLSLSQKSTSTDISAAWGRRRSSTFTELSTDSGLGSSSMQSWADQRSGASSSFSPSSSRLLSVISETSNFAFSPVLSSQEASRDSFASDFAAQSANASPCPVTPTHRVIALRTRSRGSPLTPKQSTQHCSPSPSLPQHIQALVRGGFKKPQESATSPTAAGVGKKSFEKQSLFASVVGKDGEQRPRASSLKRVATTECMDTSSSDRPSLTRLPFGSPFGEAKKLKSNLESIKEGIVHSPVAKSLEKSKSSIVTPLQKSANTSQSFVVENCTPLSVPSSASSSSAVASSVTVTTNATTSAVQAPPDTCMIGDGSRPYLLPCRQHESTVMIESSELANLIAGKYSSQVKRFHIIDCRYPYEHEGGHIKGAVNHPNEAPLLKEFFGTDHTPPSQSPVRDDDNDDESKRTLLIFHCEFSSKRAPDMVKKFRTCDRNRNRHNYPRLHYPEVYMLAGGYKAFYEYCCTTNQLQLLDGGYTPMHAEEHNHELRRWKKYKTMSAVEDRLVKNAPAHSISPLSSNCSGADNSRISLSQQDSLSNPSGGCDENNRPYRQARRNPLVRRQLSSFSVPSHQASATSPLMKRCESTKLADKNTPLSSHFANSENDAENSENRPPTQW